jgi:hypothetical protein
MPNAFAYIALFSFPILAGVLFKRLPLPSALIWTLLLGYLLLPEGTQVDFPLLPTFNKESIPSLSALLFTWLAIRRESQSTRFPPIGVAESITPKPSAQVPADQGRRSRLIGLMLLLLLIGPMFTVYSNREAVFFGPRGIRGLEWYDGFSMTLEAMVGILPFILARRHITSDEGFEALLRALATAGGVYSLLVLFEIRMSPQLHNWIYGFFPHSFIQQKRGDGFRSTVFLIHGLKVALVLASACIAAAALSYLKKGKEASRWRWLAIWLFGVLILQKSLGALLITIVLVCLTIFSRPVFRIMVLAGLVSMVLLYPMLRGAGWIPVDRIYEFAYAIDPLRASSLNVRLVNEEILLERAEAKPLFGWGGWGRSRVYSDRGRDISISDGLWVIVIGAKGWLGYIATFSLWCLPVLMMYTRRRQFSEQLLLPLAGATILVATLVDLIPNSGIPSLTWLFAGALLGWIESKDKQKMLGEKKPS